MLSHLVYLQLAFSLFYLFVQSGLKLDFEKKMKIVLFSLIKKKKVHRKE